MDDIKDVKPPVNLPVEVAEFKWWLVVAAAAGLIALAVFFYMHWRKRRGEVLPPVLQVPPWEIAFRQLEELAVKQYPEKGMFKAFYIALSDIARHYLENRFGIRAPEMTTEEFLNFANRSTALKDTHKTILRDFLSGCDMVKFAKHQPSVNDAKAHFDLVTKLIEETKPPEQAA